MLIEKKYGGRVDKFWRGEAKILPGSYKLTNPPAVGTFIDRGVLLHVDTSKLEATIVKTVKAVKNISGTSLSVAKDSLIVAGDIITNGTATAVVLSVDKSDTEEDVLTLDGTIAGVVAGNVLFQTKDVMTAKGEAFSDIDGVTLELTPASTVAEGDIISDGSAARATVVTLVTTDPTKDVLTLDKTIAGIKDGDPIYVVTDGTTPLGDVNAVVGAYKEVDEADGDSVLIEAAYEANVLKDIAAPCPETWLEGGYCLKKNHAVKYFNQ